MPYFSSEQDLPEMRTAHRAVERLSQEIQELQCRIMNEDVQLTEEQMGQLTKLCRCAVRRLRTLVPE
jgi:hypothetical protein